jgi:hypothetical protein
MMRAVGNHVTRRMKGTKMKALEKTVGDMIDNANVSIISSVDEAGNRSIRNPINL